MSDSQPSGRKITLNTEIYCPYAQYIQGGQKDCDHDFPPEKDHENDYSATWKCTRCGMKVYYEVWD